MDRRQFSEVNRHLVAALDLPPERRATYLDENCPRAEIRREVEAKLAHAGDDTESGVLGALRRVAVEALQDLDAAHDQAPLQRVDRFRLIEVIGEGAIGVVWLAEQDEPLRRRVAIKIVKAGQNSREVLARFAVERRALALMDHANIAKVFDAGQVPGGGAYFAMEHVDGSHITAYCDDHRLGMRERLELFCQVCDGVQHAHQKAIIHRDLKPSNILVTENDGRPVPKIIDFGIAKATSPSLDEDTLLTVVGQLVGTPDYMSPEQASLNADDVDVRTDVYSLGVLLYELLTGVLPLDSTEFRDSGVLEFCRIVRERDPKRPSTRLSELGDTLTEISARRQMRPGRLVQRLKGDLDWITTRALEKDRERRYASPAALAADIRRHLREEPVRARPPSLRYRLTKVVRRNRLAAAVSAIGLVAVLGFAVFSWIQADMVARERDRANQEAATSRRVSTFLADMLSSADPEQLGSTLREDLRSRVAAGGRRRESGNGAADSLLASFDRAMEPVNATDAAVRLIDKEILARASATVGGEFGDEPRIAGELRHALGVTYGKLGLYEESLLQLEQAVEIRKTILGPRDPETLASLQEYGNALMSCGRSVMAEPHMLDVLTIRRLLLGDRNEGTLTTMLSVALLLKIQTRFAEAETLYREVWETSRAAADDKAPFALRARHGLGIMFSIQGRHVDAERILRPLWVDVNEVFGPEHRQTLAVAMSVGIVLGDLGQFNEATTILRETLETRRRLLGENHPITVVNQTNLANVLVAAGRTQEARALLEAATATSNHHLGESSHATLFATSSLALFLRRHDPSAESLEYLREVCDNSARIAGRTFFATMRLQEEYAGFCVDRGEMEAARTAYATLLETRRQVAVRPDSGPAARSEYSWLLMTCRVPELRDTAAALAFAREACAMTEYRDPVYLDTLAFAMASNGQAAAARQWGTKAVDLLAAGDDRHRSEMQARFALYGDSDLPAGRPLAFDVGDTALKSSYLYACHY